VNAVSTPVQVAVVPEPAQVKRALTGILDHLDAHPRARDTLRGIAEWWAHSTVPATEAALSLLLERGLLQRIARNGQQLFGRNDELRLDQWQALVRQARHDA
jgi:uncharacterized protein (DUF2236 family)